MREKAYAKINLSINIKGVLSTGYHDLDMIMLPINLYDIVDIKLSKETKYQCNVDCPYDENNLVYKCIEVLRKEYGFKQQFDIKLTKNIPMCAGLAGGSTDGAAAMRIVNKLLKLNISQEMLAQLASKVGADIPFCIYSKPARVKGFGEIVEPIDLDRKFNVLLIKPEQGINTKECYQLADKLEVDHPNIDKLYNALMNNESIEELLGNSLQIPAIQILDTIGNIIEDCKKFGYKDVLMSGSGSTVFVLGDENEKFTKLIKHAKENYKFVIKTNIFTM